MKTLSQILMYKKTIAAVIVAVLAALSAVGYNWQFLNQDIVDQIIENLQTDTTN